MQTRLKFKSDVKKTSLFCVLQRACHKRKTYETRYGETEIKKRDNARYCLRACAPKPSFAAHKGESDTGSTHSAEEESLAVN